jgi:hypothetical protein
MMAKLKNVSQEELKAAGDAASDLMATLHDLSNRMEKMYVDDNIQEPIAMVRTYNALARAALNMVSQLLVKSALDEQKRQIETMLKERDKQAD